MTTRAYALYQDPSDLGLATADVDAIGWDAGSARCWEVEPMVTPDPIMYLAKFARLKQTDWPVNPQGHPIMSQRMLRTLLDVSPFPHRAIDLALFDGIGLGEVALARVRAIGRELPTNEDVLETARGLLRERWPARDGLVRDDFVLVQLLSHVDAFDWERSVYELSPRLPGRITEATRICIKDVPLPPLFRLSAYPYQEFVSAAARDALDRAGIRGPMYLPVDSE